jgi:hypothetical protein
MWPPESSWFSRRGPGILLKKLTPPFPRSTLPRGEGGELPPLLPPPQSSKTPAYPFNSLFPIFRFNFRGKIGGEPAKICPFKIFKGREIKGTLGKFWESFLPLSPSPQLEKLGKKLEEGETPPLLLPPYLYSTGVLAR